MARAAVIFDLDGTLTEPYLDFDAIRAEIGIAGGPILEAISQMGGPARRRAHEALLKHEWEAARNATLQDNAAEVVVACKELGYLTAILTRNARAVAEHVIQRFGLRIDALRTREDGVVKPSPEPVLALCEMLAADPRRSWVVGDYLFDLQAGRGAGARTALLIGAGEPPEFAGLADVLIRRLAELPEILEECRHI